MRYIWLLCFLCFSCINKRDRSHHFVNTSICDGQLFREKFRVCQGGVYAGDTYADYVTDSASFRTFIGIHNDAGGYIYRCASGLLSVEKFETSLSPEPKIISLKVLRIDSLREVNPL